MSDRALELFERFLEQRASGQQPDPAALVHEAGDQADVLAGMIAAYVATHPADVTEPARAAGRPSRAGAAPSLAGTAAGAA